MPPEHFKGLNRHPTSWMLITFSTSIKFSDSWRQGEWIAFLEAMAPAAWIFQMAI
jgi:hypothetical protein